jgi:hypothetical protein
MNIKSTTTTIRINHKTKDKLSNMGRKNQSYDSIVLFLLEEHYNGIRQSK